MDIVIVAQYLRNIENFSGNNSRFVYLAKMLANDLNNKVEIITSDFNHSRKENISKIGELKGVTVTPIHESGYGKNVCLKRFISHMELAKNIKKYLSNRKKPDVCYCAVPSLDVAKVVADYCKKNKIRFILDVQDLWPEAFKMVFNIPILSDLIFLPMQRRANYIYKQADEIVAVSETYANRAMKVNNKCKKPTVVYLGTEKDTFDIYAQSSIDKEDEIIISYIGSMSNSYDLFSIIDAISCLKINKNIKLLAMGDGFLKEKFIEYAKEKNIKAEFTGMLPYPKMLQRLVLSDIAINLECKSSVDIIINKVGDYAMAGLPVINIHEYKEYRNLLQKYEAGINCEPGNVCEITAALERIIMDIELKKKMSLNSRKLGIEYFKRKNIYYNLVDKLLLDNMEKKIIRIAYCGTLGHSYNISCILEAMRKLKTEDLSKIEFIIMGDGPKMEEFKNKSKNLPVIFTGRLPYFEMIWVLSCCDIAVNPISKGAAQSIINKHMDYAMAGLPVINTQECEEYRNLVDKYEMGFNCENGNIEEIMEKILYLLKNKQLRKKMGLNARKCGEEKFDRKKTYKEIYDVIMERI